MSRITPASVAAEWVSTVIGLDPLFFHAEARRFIVDPDVEAAAIRTAVAHEAILRPTAPDFFATADYDWAFDPASWDRGIDAVFQMRVLQMLSTLQGQPQALTDLDFGRIVVRRVDSVTAFDCSPRFVRAPSLRFVVMPFVFSELAGLLLRGFAEWIGGDTRADWDALVVPFMDETRECPPSLRQAIARMLTDPAFDLFSAIEQPAWTLRREASWFAPAREFHETGESNLAEAHLSYALHDFALAHELGHALLGHARPGPGDDRMARELAADDLAMRLYAGSWGWRDELLDGAPLDQAARNLLGPIMFVWFCEWQMTLVFACTARLRERMTEAERAEFRSQGEAWHAEQQRRAQVLLGMAIAYPAAVIAHGGRFPIDDATGLGHLQANMGRFAGQIGQWVLEIPESAIDVVQALLDDSDLSRTR